MLKNYLKIAYRNLVKTKLFTLVNISGLSIGMAAFLLIIHYVFFEQSYDQFHSQKDRIYRLRYERTSDDGSAVRFASCCPPAGARIREQLTDVEQLSRLFKYRAVVRYEDIRFTEERIFYCEPQFFEIFDFKILQGDPLEILDQPNKAVITTTMAKKYFGSKNPVGKILKLDNDQEFEIAGLMADLPENSHIKMDLVLPWKNLEKKFGPEYYEAWGHSGSFTYIKLHEGVDVYDFKKKIAALVERVIGAAWREYNIEVELPLQPLDDIHLTSNYMQEYEPNGNAMTVKILSIIAFFIIIIAWVNYINLSTARSLMRAKEVGLRKTVGAFRHQIMAQFTVETILVNLISLLCSLILIQLLWPFFSQITGMPVEHTLWQETWFWPILILLFAAGVLLSGAYPVIVLSSFKPIKVLRGKLGNSVRGLNLRKALVTVQFIIALALTIGTLAVFNQVYFMQNRDVGFEMEQILVVKTPRIRDKSFSETIDSFKKSLLGNTGIEQFSVVTEVPGKQLYWDAGGIQKAGEENKSKNYYIVGTDFDFFDLFNLPLVAGRGFSREYGDETDKLVFNEKAVQWMGFKDAQTAIGQQVNYWNKIYTIIGVVKNYHQQFPKTAVEPQIYRFMPTGRGNLGHFAIKVNSSEMQNTIDLVRKNYDAFFPGNPFDFFFIDEYYNRQYQADRQFGRVFAIFAALAIFVTSLGILGLAAFLTTQRTKEIGIRKVLGASVNRLLILLTKDFLLLIGLSFLIIIPLTYWSISRWLESFAYQMSIGIDIYIIPFLLILLITIITMGVHVLKAALNNPINALRYE